MATLSLGMIVKDEELTLGRVLAAASTFCDEIIVVDTGSTDRTIAIASELGAKVTSFAWIDDFAAARNAAFAQCSKEWIMWLDADDYIPADSCSAIREMKTTLFDDPAVDIIFSPYHWAFESDGKVREKFDRERFVRSSAKLRWVGQVHETLLPIRGRCTRSLGAIVQHRTAPQLQPRKKGRNLRIMRKFVDIDKSSPHEVYHFGCELLWNNLPEEASEVFGRYLSRQRGQPDSNGELYLATIKLADISFRLGKLDKSLRLCLEAFLIDSTRAEAPCLAGRFLLSAGRAAEAWPYLLMASCAPLPTHSPKQIFTWFYDHHARKECLEAQRALGNAKQQLAQLQGLRATTLASFALYNRDHGPPVAPKAALVQTTER